MNWKTHLFKPKWQHKDPLIRREAVTHLPDPELLLALPGICLDDEDATVRMAAARRVSDLVVLMQALDKEQDTVTREAINQRLFQLCGLSSEDRPPIEQRKALIQSSTDRKLLELLASSAPEAEVRLQALSRTDRQGFLGDRAIHDSDAEIRQAAAAAISQHSTLRRVIEGTRKTDKLLHQELRERLHRELLEAGDADAINEEAMAICLKLEGFALESASSHAGPAEVPAEISMAWEQVAGHVSPALRLRYEHTRERLLRVPEPGPAEPVSLEEPGEGAEAPAALSEAVDLPEPVDHKVREPSPLPGLLNQLKEQAPALLSKPSGKKLAALQGAWAKAQASITDPDKAEVAILKEGLGLLAELEQAESQSRLEVEQRLELAGQLLARYGEALKEGALHKALETRFELSELGKLLGRNPAWNRIRQEMGALHGRLKELRDWQHWSNDTHRKQLIKEMEVLPQAGLHPDALLDRVQSLQHQWKALEESEQIPGEPHFSAAPWMWRKFKSAGNNAFNLAKPFLDKRSEVRKGHLDELKDLVQRIRDAAGSENPNWVELRKLTQSGRKEFAKLDDVPQKARHKAATMLKDALDTANSVVQAHYEKVELEKRKLIRAAEQLTHLADVQEAIRQAKRLQSDWKAAGSLWRSQENRLWGEFRGFLDPLFGKVKAEQESEREAQLQSRQAQQALCDELRKILALKDPDLADAGGRVQGLRDGWRDIEHQDRKLVSGFESLSQKYDQRVAQFQAAQADKIHQQWWIKSALLHQLESAALNKKPAAKTVSSLLAKWPGEPSTHPLDQALDARVDAFRADPPQLEERESTLEQARALCIQLEFLAGLPSPEAEKDLRMTYQVDRLSESMAGLRERISAADEAAILESEWLTLGVLNSQDHQRFEQRIKAALKELSGIINA